MVKPFDEEGKRVIAFKRLQPFERMLFAAAALVLILLGILVLYLQIEALYHARMQELELIASIKLEKISTWHEERRADAREVMSSEHLILLCRQEIESPDHDREDRIRLLDYHFEPLRRRGNYADVLLISPEMDVIYSKSRSGAIDRDFLQREIAAHDGQSAFISNLTHIPPYGSPGMYVVAPLMNNASEDPFAYVVFLSYARDYLYPLVQYWPGMEKTGEVLLLEKAGGQVRLVTPPRFAPLSPLTTFLPAEGSRSAEAIAVSGKSGSFAARDYRGTLVLACAWKVPDFDWILLAKLDNGEVVKGWLGIFAIFIIYVALIIAATLFAGNQLLSSRAIAAYRSRLALLRRAEKSEALLSTILNNVPSLILVTSSKGSILFSNRSYQEHFGSTVPDQLAGLLGNQASSAAPGDEGGMIIDPVCQSRRIELEDVQGNQLVLSAVPFSIALKNQPRMNGLVLRDMTEIESNLATIHALNEQLQQRVDKQTRQILAADEELRAATAAISHDLASPARTIESYSGLIEQKESESLSPEGRSYLGRIRSSSARILQLLEELRIFLSIDRTLLHREPCDIASIANEIISDYVRRNPNRRYAITIAPGIRMDCDRRLMTLALRHVIDNAFRYAFESETLVLEVAGDGQGSFYIRDNGIGMNEEELQSALKPAQGTGMKVGLAVTRKIVERHGGRLELESEPGKGTLVRFRF